jgi:beta-glucosidase
MAPGTQEQKSKQGEAGQPPVAPGHAAFDYRDLKVQGGDTIVASFTVTNTGERAGADVPQLYLTEAAGDKRMRLLGLVRVELRPGETRQVTITAEPRLLARFAGNWRIAEGLYRVALGRSAADLPLAAEAWLRGQHFVS